MWGEIDAVIKDKKPESIAVEKEIVNDCLMRSSNTEFYIGGLLS